MTSLEYRLIDDQGQFPVLYYYQDIDETEVSARFVCDYFVKDAIVYERQSCAMEPLNYVIYVKRSQEVALADSSLEKPRKNIRIEIRHFSAKTEEYPVLFSYEVKYSKEALLYLQSDYFMWSGEEWEKTSAELDEDRMVYVVYAKPVEVND
ncbi:MAG: hypothetical protein LLG02_03070 [Pelosinus sp.]|nr:hypothetical protein [Pelosinus sp.]